MKNAKSYMKQFRIELIDASSRRLNCESVQITDES